MRRWCAAGIVCATVPDLDALGRPFGRGDILWLGGHRGLTHSIAFAAVVAWIIAPFLVPRSSRATWRMYIRAWVFLLLATCTHGLLDALTTYDAGVALLAPLSADRFRFPVQPIRGLFTEMFYVWLPLGFAGMLVLRARRASAGVVDRRDFPFLN